MTSPKIERFVELETPDGKKIVFGVPTDIKPVELEPPKGSITVRLPSPNDIRFTPIDLRSRFENKARELSTFPDAMRSLFPVRELQVLPGEISPPLPGEPRQPLTSGNSVPPKEPLPESKMSNKMPLPEPPVVERLLRRLRPPRSVELPEPPVVERLLRRLRSVEKRRSLEAVVQ